MIANESGRFEIDIGSGCTGSDQCRWTDIKSCFDGCAFDTCNNMDYGDDDKFPKDGTKVGNIIALTFNIIGLLLLTVAIILIIVMYIKSMQDKIGIYIGVMVGLSGLCELIAIIAMVAGNAPKNECWDDPSPDSVKLQYKTSAGPGITFYLQITPFLTLNATLFILKEYGAEGTTN